MLKDYMKKKKFIHIPPGKNFCRSIQHSQWSGKQQGFR